MDHTPGLMELVSYDEALALVRGGVRAVQDVEKLDLAHSLGRALSEPLIAVDNYPRFDNSAVDGYVIGSARDASAGTLLSIAGTCKAGEQFDRRIPEGCAVRIFTGAPVPQRSYAVVMQEDVRVREKQIELLSRASKGDHIRRAGEDYTAGSELLSAGVTITEGVIAALATEGRAEVDVYRKPRVAVLTTGDELVDISEEPQGAQIRDSNGPMIAALVEAFGGAPAVFRCIDAQSELEERLRQIEPNFDLILISGGASVGDYDFVAGAVAELGEIIFHGVAIRPGKPILFGRAGHRPVFGLPGNPASAYVCFLLFVAEYLKGIGGHVNCAAPWFRASLRESIRANSRDTFARVRVLDGDASLVRAQGSFGVRSIAEANALARIPSDRGHTSGEVVRVMPLRW